MHQRGTRAIDFGLFDSIVDGSFYPSLALTVSQHSAHSLVATVPEAWLLLLQIAVIATTPIKSSH